MFFTLSKLFWFVFVPSHVVIWPPIATAALLWRRRIRLARRFGIASAALVIVLGVIPLGTLALRPLENRFPRPAWPSHVDGILVLGGGLDPAMVAARRVVGHIPAEPRLVAAFELARRYPNARVIFSGGSGELSGADGEAPAAKYIFSQLGLSPERLTLEDKSRNTWENLAFSQRIAKPRQGEVWLLATSASHMPRAMGVAARLHWKMVPWPTGYETLPTGSGPWFDLPHNLTLADTAFHEWIGLLVYGFSDKM